MTKTYELNVTRVLKEVDILESETMATIARINAQAQRQKNIIINSANAQVQKWEVRSRAVVNLSGLNARFPLLILLGAGDTARAIHQGALVCEVEGGARLEQRGFPQVRQDQEPWCSASRSHGGWGGRRGGLNLDALEQVPV